MKQELKVLVKARVFRWLVGLAALHCLARLLQVVAYDSVVQNPNNPMAGLFQQFAALTVNETMFFDFIRIQAPIVFLLCLFAGSGMICGDFRNNLMEIYFSKPISWIDYTLGKVLTLVLIGLSLTALPAVGLTVLHNLLMPSMETVRDSYWWPGVILIYSLIVVLPCALCILASSALLGSSNNASMSIFLLLSADAALGKLLAELLRERNYLILSFPETLNRIGQALFRQHEAAFNLNGGWSMLFVALVCLWALWIIARRVRRAEIAA